MKRALRNLLRRPLQTGWLVLAVALGLGAATTVLSAVHAFLLRPLPFPDAHDLVRIRSVRLLDDGPERSAEPLGLSYADYLDLVTDARSLGRSAFFGDSWLANLHLGDGTLTFPGVIASGDFFQVLGAEAARGRTLRPADDDPSAPLAVVIGHGLWQGPLGGEADVVGRTLRIGDDVFTVVGVMPPGFAYPRDAELWIAGARFFDRRRRGFRVDQALARLRGDPGTDDDPGTAPGGALDAARAELSARAAELASRHPETNAGVGVAVVRELEVVAGDLRSTLETLGLAALLLYLVCSANVSQWVMVRAAARREELAIRRVLGARMLGARGVYGLLVTETLLPVLAGSAAGLWIAWLATRRVAPFLPDAVPAWIRLEPRPTVVALHFAFALVLALGAAAWPALRARHDGNAPTLRTGRGSLGDAGRGRRALVTAEIALALVLLLTAGLATCTLHDLMSRDPGLDPENVLTVGLNFSADVSREDKAVELARAIEALRALPAVEAAGVSSDLSLVGQETWDRHELRDADGRLRGVANLQQVEGDLLAALGVPLLAGRGLSPPHLSADTSTERRDLDVVVSRSLAEALWGSPRAALGERLALGPASDAPLWRRVVGVAGDVRHDGWTGDAGFDVYAPFPPGHVPKETHLALRTGVDPASLGEAVRRALATAAPRIGVHDLRPLAERLEGSVRRERLWTGLLLAFASVALVLSLGGLYGVIAASVAGRTREIGLRMAVGARGEDVARMVLGESARTLAAGVVLGLGLAFVAVRFVARVLGTYGASPWDLRVWILVPLVLSAGALAATWWPARRAARLDPRDALRDV